MLNLLKILSYVYINRLDNKNADYRKGFSDCLELLRVHLLKTGVINEIVQLKRKLELTIIAKDAMYNVLLRKAGEYKTKISHLTKKIEDQTRTLGNYQRKIEEQKDRGLQFRRRIAGIINSTIVPEEEKLKLIMNNIKSYNDGEEKCIL